MLPFLEQIVADLLDDPNGGLVVLSSGLPIHSLVASLLLLHHPSQGSLLILSASDSQKSSISRTLLQDPNPNPIRPTDIPGDVPSHHRTALYASGASYFVTPRILIADLLTSRVPPSSIAGLLILNAHRLTDTSTEAFIARTLRFLSRNAYVRALTDHPHAMVSGFAKAERIMKCLYVRRLHLWPRFHVLVSGDLEQSPPEVVDIRVPMTPAMRGIQQAVLETMDACLKELRKTNKVDVEDLTVENGLFKSFDEVVRRQLDPIWHTLGKKTKQLVSDLRTLRKLLDYLVRYDAVTYLKYLDTLRVSEGVRSVWIFAESSYKIFELAKKRVYQVLRADGVRIVADRKSIVGKRKRVSENSLMNEMEKDGLQSENSSSHSNKMDSAKLEANVGVVLEEVLEEAPKWKVLRELLEEIEVGRRKEGSRKEGENSIENRGGTSDIVLVVCKDERSCLQLEDCIIKNSHQVMRQEWEKYLFSKAELHSLQKRNKKRSQDPEGYGVLDGTVTGGSFENSDPTTINKLENNALLAAASEICHIDKEEATINDESRPLPRRRSSAKGRRRGQSQIARNSRNNFEKSTEKVQIVKVNSEAAKPEAEINVQRNDLIDKSLESSDAKPIPPIQFYDLENDEHILDVWRPSVIIVFHPDMKFVREIEVYKAENPSVKLKVYFLFYENSTEVQKFEASIRRENGAFESLIRQKSLLMIPVDQDGRCIGPTPLGEPSSVVLQNSLTRKAGGRKTMEKEMQVIVDMREFMSSLPNVLNQKGMKIIPVTLEVGDYVLSPLICVERKSIGDLFQSFASGRLYHQVETMARYYKIPVLLIEFSQDRSFSFQSSSELGDDVSPTSIISKLSLLVLHFPRLRLVWSRSMHATAEIFASLKANQDEPDENKAIRVGVPTEDGVVEDDVRAENYNTTAIEFLRRLPGVTDSNYRTLMDGCKSLAELALLPVERLAELMGGQKPAKMLREFLDAKCPTMP
ncbi:DNA repair endonuclease UVH1 [Phalaenopsis equestris]|uniref:DNA repair endonuclease UVH1 n=1 Tax=Phalaenopsis equestris TaxID=78828 RepID=UPI0009E45BEE|nr:DNA repair endonuclease UVH1 [Phalaenopsis equestris]XP_020586236.1 DNA repair endonuclease UVH1 [Phalaenopsis equestris]